MRAIAVGAALAGLIVGAVAPAAGQRSLGDRCDHGVITAAGARDACLAAAQAAVSAQPVVGLLMAGGSPTTGSAVGGLRLGVVPRVSTGARLNLVRLQLPDIVSGQISGGAGDVIESYGATIPAFSVDLSVAVTSGIEIAPGIGGIGGISLLGSASYLPFSVSDDAFEASDFAYGVGARVHLLEESFVAPAISVAVMRRALSTVEFGNVCPEGATDLQPATPPNTRVGTCTGPGDPGEIAFDLVDWSGRAVVSKHVLGFGATFGLGYDRYASDLDLGFRAPPIDDDATIFRVRDERLRARRWVLFGGVSYNILVVNLSAEAGWQRGGAPVSGFDDLETEFDPRDGSWFGSLGVRIAL